MSTSTSTSTPTALQTPISLPFRPSTRTSATSPILPTGILTDASLAAALSDLGFSSTVEFLAAWDAQHTDLNLLTMASNGQYAVEPLHDVSADAGTVDTGCAPGSDGWDTHALSSAEGLDWSTDGHGYMDMDLASDLSPDLDASLDLTTPNSTAQPPIPTGNDSVIRRSPYNNLNLNLNASLDVTEHVATGPDDPHPSEAAPTPESTLTEQQRAEIALLRARLALEVAERQQLYAEIGSLWGRVEALEQGWGMEMRDDGEFFGDVRAIPTLVNGCGVAEVY
ncbi:MAG: hypothetical protein LQ340_005725 [Diploschistes diacapsis]|nr:MAG: hypothetical protein LQ340_005725 [Diploschistes diacapsis]